MKCTLKYSNVALLLLFTTLTLLKITVSHAQTSISLNIDNDWVTGTDEDYTSGFTLRFAQSIATNSSYASLLPHRLWRPLSDASAYWEIEAGQKIWTPTILLAPTTLPGERPYAGVLYLQTSLSETNDEVSHRYSFLFGTTGERSFAENTQKYFHKLFGSVKLKGWDTQVDDKWLFNLGYQGNYNLYRTAEIETETQHELSNISRVLIGNYRSELATALMWRWGTNLNHSFGSTTISNETPFNAGAIRGDSPGLFVFSGIEARLRFYDITIDGNRPAGLPSVSVEPLQATAVIGIASYFRSWGGSFSLALKTNDFKESENAFNANASMSIFYRF